MHSLNSVLRTPLRSVTVSVGFQLRLKDRFDYQLGSSLYHSILYTGDAERPLTATGLGYLHPPVGINLFLSAYRFKKPMGTIIWATLPFLFILMGTVLLITYVPWMTTGPLEWLGRR